MSPLEYLKVKGMSRAVLLAASMVVGYEGYVSGTYVDPVGIVTSCYGHVDPSYREGQLFTEGECNELLRKDLARFERRWDRLVEVEYTPYQKAAGVSLMYSIGDGAFASSTALRLLNKGDSEGFCSQFIRWVYAKGSYLRGLFIRRTDEKRVCMGDLREDEWEILKPPSSSPS